MTRATRALTGILCLLMIHACGGSGTATRDELADLKAYVDSGPYATKLASCAMANTTWRSCSLDTLPVLGMEHAEPDIAQIMERVTVSHDWMGQRFEQLLTHLPEDLMYLFGGVTAIVIDADIRPSYYWSLTGAIYIDPASLWLTLEEKDSINRKLDHRSGNGSDMRLRYYSRSAINGRDAYRHFGLDSKVARSIDDIIIPMSNLLFHELTHANDRLPRALYATVERHRSVASITDRVREHYTSGLLSKEMPLTSSLVFELASIFYHGTTPNEEQTFWSGAELGQAFAEDGANDLYGFSSKYEDLAMLVEETMMHIHFGIKREQAFIEAPEQASPHCGEALIGWGERHRIGDPWVRERIKFALAELFPHRDYSLIIDNLAEPEPLQTGQDWCEMVDEQRQLGQTVESQQHKLPMQMMLRRPHLHP